MIHIGWALVALAAAPSWKERYEALFAKFPVNAAPLKNCVEPKLLENRQTRRYRTALRYKLREDPVRVNFCGRYFVMAQPITGGGDVYVADCETGKIITQKDKYAVHWPITRADSCLLIENLPSPEDERPDIAATGSPRLFRWTGRSLSPEKDPLFPGTDK